LAILIAHRTTSGEEAAGGTRILERGSLSLRNGARTNRLLGPVRLHLNNGDDAGAYHRMLREHAETSRDRGQRQRLNRDVRGANRVRNPLSSDGSEPIGSHAQVPVGESPSHGAPTKAKNSKSDRPCNNVTIHALLGVLVAETGDVEALRRALLTAASALESKIDRWPPPSEDA